MPLGLHAGWRLSDRIGVHGEVVQHTESQGFDEFLGGEETRTLRWWTAGATFHFKDSGRVRPHFLTGFEMLVERDNNCDLIRRAYPDNPYPCESFPHRIPGVNVGLGIDIPFGRRFFARIQYLTSAIYVSEVVGISSKARLVVGVGF